MRDSFSGVMDRDDDDDRAHLDDDLDEDDEEDLFAPGDEIDEDPELSSGDDDAAAAADQSEPAVKNS